VVAKCEGVEDAEVEVKAKTRVASRKALDVKIEEHRRAEVAREAHVEEAEAAARTIKAPEAARLQSPSVAFGTVSIEYSLPAHADEVPPCTKEFGLFPAGTRDSWFKLGEVQGKRQGVLNLDVEGIPPGDYDLAMVAMGAIQTAKEMMVGEVALTYKYKYNTDGMQVDATWDIQPLVAASPTMWVGIFKEGAALTEPIDFAMLKGPDGAAMAAGSSTFSLAAAAGEGPLEVAAGSKLVVRVLWGYNSVLSEGTFAWPQ